MRKDHNGVATRFSYEGIDAAESAGGGIGQFLFMGLADPDAVRRLVLSSAPEGSVRLTHLTSDSGWLWLEALPSAASKSSGLAHVAALHALEAGDCVAFGNDWNDLDMFQWAGSGCALGNTPDDFKAHLAEHCPHVRILAETNDNRGVWIGLTEHFPVPAEKAVVVDADAAAAAAATAKESTTRRT